MLTSGYHVVSSAYDMKQRFILTWLIQPELITIISHTHTHLNFDYNVHNTRTLKLKCLHIIYMRFPTVTCQKAYYCVGSLSYKNE